MENKLELRVGDVVRLFPLTITEIYDDGDLCFKEDVGLISPDLVDEIISRGEIARLEAENARLEAELAKAPRRIEWGGGECPVGGSAKVLIWFRDGSPCMLEDDPNEMSWSHSHGEGDIIAYMVLPS